MEDLAAAYRGWVEASLKEGSGVRGGMWTESIAVGSEALVRVTKDLGSEHEGVR
jgi:hypothetical protein